MKCISILALLCIAFCSNAQRQYVGIKGGGAWSNVKGSDLFAGAEGRRGIGAGVSFDYFLKEHLSVGAELLYQERGMTAYEPMMNSLGAYSQEQYAIKFRYDYACLPIKVTYTLGDKVQGFGSVGVVPGFLLSATTVAPVFLNDKHTGDETLVATDYVRKFDCAGLVEAGLGYKYKKRYMLFGAVSYQHGLTTITGPKYLSREKIMHEVLGVVVGLKVGLKA
jgi:hypothetical protein